MAAPPESAQAVDAFRIEDRLLARVDPRLEPAGQSNDLARGRLVDAARRISASIDAADKPPRRQRQPVPPSAGQRIVGQDPGIVERRPRRIEFAAQPEHAIDRLTLEGIQHSEAIAVPLDMADQRLHHATAERIVRGCAGRRDDRDVVTILQRREAHLRRIVLPDIVLGGQGPAVIAAQDAGDVEPLAPFRRRRTHGVSYIIGRLDAADMRIVEPAVNRFELGDDGQRSGGPSAGPLRVGPTKAAVEVPTPWIAFCRKLISAT